MLVEGDDDPDDEFDDMDDEPDETDGILSEPGETWGWPSAVSFIAFVFAIAFMWHDCVVHR
jgi:hypothetical protein